MADLREVLHDEIDKVEELKDDARQVIATVVKDELAGIVSNAPDLRTAMKQIADRVEDGLEPLTRKAFKAGVGFSRRRFDER